MLQSTSIKQNKLYFADVHRVLQSVGRTLDGDLRGQLYRITVNAGGDGGKRDALNLQSIGHGDRFAMTTGQCFRLVTISTAPHGTNRVNDIFRGQAASRSSYSFSRLQPALPLDNDLAGFQNGGPSHAMNSAVHAASAHQRGIRCIHDCVTGFTRNVAGSLYDQQTVG